MISVPALGSVIICGRAPHDSLAERARDAQIAALRKEKQRLEQELAKARFVMDVQAKLQALLEQLSKSEGTAPQ